MCADEIIHNPKTLSIKIDSSPEDPVDEQCNKMQEIDGYIDHYIVEKVANL